MKRSRTLLFNTILLTTASLLLRAVGVSFQVYLSERIGAAGMGLFGLISSANMLAITVATSGVRFATTRLVSEEMGLNRPAGAARAVRHCLGYALFFGTLAALGLFFGAGVIGNVWIGDSRTVLSLRILAVALPFLSMSAVFGGYFTAVQRVAKSTAVGVTENLLRIGVVVGILILYAPSGLEAACAAIVVGDVISEIVSFLLLFLLYSLERRRKHQGLTEGTNMSRRMLGIALPLAASAYARSALSTLEHMLVPRGLRKSGASGQSALESYGVIHGMVFPIITFPSSLFYSLGELIVPELTEAQVAGHTERIRRLVNRTLRLSLFLSIGAAGIFFFYGGELGRIIYKTVDTGGYIQLFSLLLPVLFLDAITDGMLKGLGQQLYSMSVNIADSLISVVLVYTLLPMYAVKAYIGIVYFTECFNFFLSIRRIAALTTLDVRLRDILRSILAIIGAANMAMLLLRLAGLPLRPSPLPVVLHIAVSGLFYFLLLQLLSCVTKQDIIWAKGVFSAK